MTGVPEDASSVQAASGTTSAHVGPLAQPKQEQACSPSDQVPWLLQAALLRSSAGLCTARAWTHWVRGPQQRWSHVTSSSNDA